VAGLWSPVPHRSEFEVHNPPGVRYELRTRDGGTRYRIGEPIPIELRFSSTIEHEYGFDAATYDRSGRLLSEAFMIDPADGHADPMAEYYGKPVLVGITGGLRGKLVLTREPAVINVYLNEWVQFRKPRRYRIFARSQRILRQRTDGLKTRVEDMPAISEALNLEIVNPERGWEEDEAHRLAKMLSDSNERTRQTAAEHLRFLGTPAALRIMARALSSSSSLGMSLTLGIIGSPHRDAARAILEDELLRPDRAVDPLLVHVLAFVRVRPWLFLKLPVPVSGLTLSDWADPYYQRLAHLHSEAFKLVLSRVVVDLASAIDGKSRAARAESLETLNFLEPARAPLPPVAETRTENPEDLRQRVLTDLRKQRPELHLWVLIDLPDKHLPELEAHFAGQAPHHPWLFGHLLARYGTSRVLLSVRQTYEAGHLRWGCDARYPFLAYFLRVSPEEGKRILTRALDERERNGCFRNMLSSVGRLHSGPFLEEVAIQRLSDEHVEVAADAAHALARYGSQNAEPHLWRRLTAWSLQWRGRERELYGNLATGEGYLSAEINLGQSLTAAISHAQAWFLDSSRQRRLLETCINDECRELYGSPGTHQPQFAIRVFQPMYAKPQIEVGVYQPRTMARFSEKVGQLPLESRFQWCTDQHGSGLTDDEVEAKRTEIRQILQSHGFRLEECTPGSIAP
jgi:hypothetical protein